MAKLVITIPNEDLTKVEARARQEGFRNPVAWARFLIRKNVNWKDSPRLQPHQVISAMRKTNLYKPSFLKELRQALEYADKTAK